MWAPKVHTRILKCLNFDPIRRWVLDRNLVAISFVHLATLLVFVGHEILQGGGLNPQGYQILSQSDGSRFHFWILQTMGLCEKPTKSK